MPRPEQVDPSIALSDYSTWVLGAGFRELIEEVQTHLDWAASFCFILKRLKEVGWERFCTDASEHEEALNQYWKKFHKSSHFPAKMEHLLKEYGLSTNLDKAVSSFQRARNCLAHRGGLVSQEFDCSEGSLDVLWMGVGIEKYGEDGPIQLRKPEDVGPGGLYMIGGICQKKSFESEKRIELTSREFNEIAMTCYFYCREISRETISYGRERLGLGNSLPTLDDKWLRDTAVYLYFNGVQDEKGMTPIVIDWKEGRIRLRGTRRPPGVNAEEGQLADEEAWENED